MALSHPMSFVLQNTIKFIGLEKNGCFLQLSIYHAPPHLGRLGGVVGETLFPKGRRVSLRSLRLKRIRWDTTALPYLLNKLGYSLII